MYYPAPKQQTIFAGLFLPRRVVVNRNMSNIPPSSALRGRKIPHKSLSAVWMRGNSNNFLRGETMNFNDTYLGIELGSTRIKAVLIDSAHNPIASGGHTWENRLEDGVWTYSLDDIWDGIRDCYANLAADVKGKYNAVLETVGAVGFLNLDTPAKTKLFYPYLSILAYSCISRTSVRPSR